MDVLEEILLQEFVFTLRRIHHHGLLKQDKLCTSENVLKVSYLQRTCNRTLEIWNRSHMVSGDMTGSQLSQLYLLFPVPQLPKKPASLSFSNQSKVKRHAETIPENEREAAFMKPISLLLRATTNCPHCKSSLIGRLRDKVALSAPVSLHKSAASLSLQ